MDTESFSKTKAMELPRNVVVGHDALHTVGEVCQSLKLGKRALIVADETTMKIAGLIVEKDLAARKIRSSEFLIPDATMEEVREGEEKIRKGNIDFALGVGGGRSIDVAKCASFNAGVPFVSVPTAASHDGVVSSRASIQKDGEKVSLAAQTPIAVIMDTGVIAAGVGERAQVLARPRPDREEARLARGAVRRRDDHDDVPPRRELAGGAGRAPDHRRTDNGAVARRHGRRGRPGPRPRARGQQGTVHNPRRRGVDARSGRAPREDHEGRLRSLAER